jgi:hypothetical protein
MTQAADIGPQEIVRVLGALRVELSHEKSTQAQIADGLTQAGIAFEREHRLSDRDVVDFLIGGTAVEVKLRRARPAEIFKQLRRYARHDRVSALVLATNRPMGLPGAIEGKPAYYVSLGRAWL